MPYKVVLQVQKPPPEADLPVERSLSPRGAHGDFLSGLDPNRMTGSGSKKTEARIEVFPFSHKGEIMYK